METTEESENFTLEEFSKNKFVLNEIESDGAMDSKTRS